MATLRSAAAIDSPRIAFARSRDFAVGALELDQRLVWVAVVGRRSRPAQPSAVSPPAFATAHVTPLPRSGYELFRADAADAGEPLERYRGGPATLLPLAMMNMLDGGVHADNPVHGGHRGAPHCAAG